MPAVVPFMSRYALIVGIGEYKNKSLKKLTKPKTDAQAVHDLLQRHGNFDDIHLLQDEKASYKRLSERLEYVLLTQGSKAKAEVLLYFTGHGFTAGPSKYDQQGYLATHDCTVTVKDRTTTHAEQAISFQFLNGLIGDADLSGLAIFLDCCHSEFFIEQALIAKNLSNCFDKQSYFLSAACRSFEQAYADRDQPHSVYTGALLQALSDEVTGDVKASEAHDKVRRQLKGSGQEPISLGLIDSLTVVTYQPAAVVVADSEDSPYQALKAFTEQTAQFFFGREERVHQLLKKLTASQFVMVLGPSGIGKSSVVQAGLVTHLLGSGWRVMKMKPGKTPMAMLEEQLRALLESQRVSTGTQRHLLTAWENDGGLVDLVTQLPEDLKVLLLVDQFEEVFTQCESEAGQRKFVGELLQVWRAEESRLAVVMTMRSDFSDDWLAAGYSPEVLDDNMVSIGPLTQENLEAAIVKPAAKQGYELEPGLLALLLADVAEEKNYLPLLEFALTELWDARDRQAKRLTVSAYNQMKGLKGALNKRAEDLYNNLRPTEQAWARRICLQLVRIGKGERDTRQRQPKAMLLQLRGLEESANHEQTQQTIADVIKDLVDGRLLVSDSGYIDLAHEALLEGWERFSEWRLEDRDLRRLVQRLEDAHEDWQERRQDERYLLSGGLLLELKEQSVQLSEILDERRSELINFFSVSDEREQTNVAALKKALAKAQLQETSQNMRESLRSAPNRTIEIAIEAIEAASESEKLLSHVIYPIQDVLHVCSNSIQERLNIGHLGTIAMLAVFSHDGSQIISAGDNLTLEIWNLKGSLVNQIAVSQVADVWSLGVSSQGDLVALGQEDGTLELCHLRGVQPNLSFSGHSEGVHLVVFNRRGNQFVSASHDGTIRIWDLEGNPVGGPYSDEFKSRAIAIEFNYEGNQIVVVYHGGNIHTWDLNNNSILKTSVFEDDGVLSADIDICGNRLIVGDEEGYLRLWDLEGNSVTNWFNSQSPSVWSVAFNRERNQIVSGGSDGVVRLWNLEGHQIGEPLSGHSDSIQLVSFSPVGNRVISCGEDGNIKLWDIENGSNKSPFAVHDPHSVVTSVSFNGKGDLVVSCGYSSQGSVQIWDAQGKPVGKPFSSHANHALFSPIGNMIAVSFGSYLQLWNLDGELISSPFRGHTHTISSIAFNVKGDRIVTGSYDGTVRLWNLKGKPIGKPFIGHDGIVESVAFSLDGKKIVSGGYDRTIRVWNLRGKLIGMPMVGHTNSVTSVVFSPEGDRIISGSYDRTIIIWDLDSVPVTHPLSGHTREVKSVAISHDGKWIISGSYDNTLRLWDLVGNPIGEPFYGHSKGVLSVAFSPQGDRIVSGSADGTLRMWPGGNWEDWMNHCCNTLMHHSALALPQTETARKASEICQQVWTRPQSAEFLVAQGSALARTGKVDEAIEKFNRAQQLDATLDFDAVARASELAEWG